MRRGWGGSPGRSLSHVRREDAGPGVGPRGLASRFRPAPSRAPGRRSNVPSLSLHPPPLFKVLITAYTSRVCLAQSWGVHPHSSSLLLFLRKEVKASRNQSLSPSVLMMLSQYHTVPLSSPRLQFWPAAPIYSVEAEGTEREIGQSGQRQNVPDSFQTFSSFFSVTSDRNLIPRRSK